MGYVTYFNGRIKFSNKKYWDIIQKLIDEDLFYFGYLEETDNSNPLILKVSGDWKNYYNQMEVMCYVISIIDNKADGEIEADGEEHDDFWKLEISNGKVFFFSGRRIYNEESEIDFNIADGKEMKLELKNIHKKLFELTKDKEFFDKAVTECL